MTASDADLPLGYVQVKFSLSRARGQAITRVALLERELGSSVDKFSAAVEALEEKSVISKAGVPNSMSSFA